MVTASETWQRYWPLSGSLNVVKGVAGLVGVGDGYPAFGFAVAVFLPLVAGRSNHTADFDAEGVGFAVVDGGGGGAGVVDLSGVGYGERAVVAYGYGAYHFNRCVAGSVADVVADFVDAGAAGGLDAGAGDDDVVADVAVDVVFGGGACVYVVYAAVDLKVRAAEQADERRRSVGYDVDGAYHFNRCVASGVADVVAHLEAGAGGVGVGGAGHADFCGEVALAAVGGAVAGVAPGLANEGVGRDAAFKSDAGRGGVLNVDDALFLDGGAEAVGDFVGDGVAPGGGGVDGVDAGGGEGAGEVAVFVVAGACTCIGVGAAAAFEGERVGAVDADDGRRVVGDGDDAGDLGRSVSFAVADVVGDGVDVFGVHVYGVATNDDVDRVKVAFAGVGCGCAGVGPAVANLQTDGGAAVEGDHRAVGVVNGDGAAVVGDGVSVTVVGAVGERVGAQCAEREGDGGAALAGTDGDGECAGAVVGCADVVERLCFGVLGRALEGDVGWDTEAGRGGVFDGEAAGCLSRGVTCSVTDVVADFVGAQRADGQRDRTGVCGVDGGDYDVVADVAPGSHRWR